MRHNLGRDFWQNEPKLEGERDPVGQFARALSVAAGSAVPVSRS
jgi:hypothetical protein